MCTAVCGQGYLEPDFLQGQKALTYTEEPFPQYFLFQTKIVSPPYKHAMILWPTVGVLKL